MFPDSKIAKNFRCGRTKRPAILNEAMKPSIKSELLNYMLKKPFALINDGSSASKLKKMNVLCVYIFDVSRNTRVACKFYDVCVTSGDYLLKSRFIILVCESVLHKRWGRLGKCCKYWLGQYKHQC